MEQAKNILYFIGSIIGIVSFATTIIPHFIKPQLVIFCTFEINRKSKSENILTYKLHFEIKNLSNKNLICDAIKITFSSSLNCINPQEPIIHCYINSHRKKSIPNRYLKDTATRHYSEHLPMILEANRYNEFFCDSISTENISGIALFSNQNINDLIECSMFISGKKYNFTPSFNLVDTRITPYDLSKFAKKT